MEFWKTFLGVFIGGMLFDVADNIVFRPSATYWFQ